MSRYGVSKVQHVKRHGLRNTESRSLRSAHAARSCIYSTPMSAFCAQFSRTSNSFVDVARRSALSVTMLSARSFRRPTRGAMNLFAQTVDVVDTPATHRYCRHRCGRCDAVTGTFTDSAGRESHIPLDHDGRDGLKRISRRRTIMSRR